jgi:hypothetical protein
MKAPTVQAGNQGDPLRGRQSGGRRAPLIGRRQQEGRTRMVNTFGHVSSPAYNTGKLQVPRLKVLLKIAMRDCKNDCSTEKKRCSHPVIVVPAVCGLPVTAFTAARSYRPKRDDLIELSATYSRASHIRRGIAPALVFSALCQAASVDSATPQVCGRRRGVDPVHQESSASQD